MKQKASALIKVGVVSSVIWCILSEEISLSVIAIGFLLGLSTAGISFLFISKTGIRLWSSMRLDIMTVLKYFAVLIITIYKAGFYAIVKIITHKTNVSIVEIETDFKDPLKRAILANSITMTPGTVTIELEDNVITVLWLDKCTSDRKKAGEIIKARLEMILKGE